MKDIKLKQREPIRAMEAGFIYSNQGGVTSASHRRM